MSIEAKLEGMHQFTDSEKFTCCKCGNHLSVAPIFALKNGVYSCGRCTDAIYEFDSNPKLERQTLYEEIAQHWQFPCCNKKKGCQEILEWCKVKEHEKNCNFGIFGCLFNAKEFPESEQCKWRGTKEEYFKHLEEHAVTANKIEDLRIWDDPKSQIIRMEILNNVLLVILIFLHNAYHFVTISKGKKGPVSYKFTVYDGNENSFCCSSLSVFLPKTLKEILKFKLHVYPNFFYPEYFSIHLNDEFSCKCNASTLPNIGGRCQLCRKTCSYNTVYTCNNNCKVCESCYTGYQLGCRACSLSNNYPSSYIIQKVDLMGHYCCRNANCSFHGSTFECLTHAEFCEFIKNKFTPISRLNFPYELNNENYSEWFFIFDELTFKLSKLCTGNSIELKLFSSEATRVSYKVEITFLEYSSELMSFPIFPNVIDQLNELRYSIVIPKMLLEQYGTHNKLKFNISRQSF